MKLFRHKRYRYRIITSVYHDDIHTKNHGKSYGIISKTDPSICVLDISTKKAVVQKLKRKCNKGNVSPVHFVDIIEDELP